MDLMDRGTLASAVRRGAFVDPTDNTIRAVSSYQLPGKQHLRSIGSGWCNCRPSVSNTQVAATVLLTTNSEEASAWSLKCICQGP